ncbi:MAG: type II secretion system F family protein, partial [Candidatus Omnitrophica bacterium]|nr:type II secretion system F family protein [Candidatus Omnitrophota bacterium]
MKYFIYKVKDESGRTLSGVQQAENKNDVKRKVSKGKYYFISAVSISKEKLFSKSVTFETLIMFTHRLTTLIEAGIPILQAMTILWRQTEEETIQVVISYMRSELEEGNRISSALSKFPKIFPVVYTALIKVGEASGALPQVLRKLS